eukprot:466584-Rhodomonas_salina.5
MSGIETCYARLLRTAICVCYAMSGTEIGYVATSRARSHQEAGESYGGSPLSYAHAMRCLLLAYRTGGVPCNVR